ncbi:hypothetical protein HMPREF0813_00686 [Streptococcus anginosus F0211]|uniref:Uncharacterized protein n=1 Tax=Streptococcus anginosus F0211 TaxID=706437 RepID=E6J0B7_STRAP|nr:hypothetical protein HMPREF0813_00686 [Streptococcus anginosus F0211]ETS95693.1 hypothetical protein HMPREF1512_1609 [Streptococcus sp. OBRC6]EUB20694.1 hypothetical protein HMPREF1510_0726 [Streptococcus sp. ACC21]EUC75973.1 hypothetical protein HMPREF1511_0415 [Streptococcus sp. CM7]EWC97477.1 hypothetical protein HMPREF1509_1115 [Streptococcus sp. AC15]
MNIPFAILTHFFLFLLSILTKNSRKIIARKSLKKFFQNDT